MKISLMVIFFSLSTSLYEAQGIKLENISASAKIIKNSSPRVHQEQGGEFSATATKLSSGINRKLMTRIISSSSTTTNKKNYKNDPRLDKKFTHGLVGKEKILHTTSASGNSKHEKTEIFSERYPDIIDVTGMDYSPVKRKPPVHN